MASKTYISIDLKSFYASVECVERGLDPMRTNLVVADASRTQKTICLAVSPALKALGVPGRPRLFEVVQIVDELNRKRERKAPSKKLTGKTCYSPKLNLHPELGIDFIVAPPRMAYYMDYSSKIYDIYMKYVAPEDIHVYSIDEVFIDATDYIRTRGISAREFTSEILRDVLDSTGITATAGIGTNLYLAKVAMDIVAKHMPADKNGARIAELDELSYRKQLWTHRPLTDFWRIGRGYAKKLEANGLYTMGDIARCSVGKDTDYYNEDFLYNLFGVNTELLIDHAWGWEPCTIADIKSFKPENNSLGSGQVLHCPYTADKARLVMREMVDLLVLDLVDKHLVTNQIILTIGYDIDNLKDGHHYNGQVTTDHYGRRIPKHAHGSMNLKQYTSSTKEIEEAFTALFDKIADPSLLIRRINISVNHVIYEKDIPLPDSSAQLDLFTLMSDGTDQDAKKAADLDKEKRMQNTLLNIKKKYGKNAILKGMNFEEGATAKDRNRQIGGHKA